MLMRKQYLKGKISSQVVSFRLCKFELKSIDHYLPEQATGTCKIGDWLLISEREGY